MGTGLRPVGVLPELPLQLSAPGTSPPPSAPSPPEMSSFIHALCPEQALQTGTHLCFSLLPLPSARAPRM